MKEFFQDLFHVYKINSSVFIFIPILNDNQHKFHPHLNLTASKPWQNNNEFIAVAIILLIGISAVFFNAFYVKHLKTTHE